MPKITPHGDLKSFIPKNPNLVGNYVLDTGFIKEIIYTDDPRNSNGKYVEYLVSVNNQERGYNEIMAVRNRDVFGGENNFLEIIMDEVTGPSKWGQASGSNDGTRDGGPLKNGSAVSILYINGKKETALIIGGMQHPSIRATENLNMSIPVFQSKGSSESRDERLQALPQAIPGAKKEGINEGHRLLCEINGVRFHVGANGEFTIVQQGMKNPDGSLVDAEFKKFPTILKFNQDGEIFLLDNKDQEIKISPKEGKIIISDGNEDPNYILIDRNKKTVAIKAKEIVTSADSIKQSADKDCLTIAKSWTLLSGENITIAANGSLILKGSVGALIL